MTRVTQTAQTGYTYKWLNSPVGRLKLVATGDALAGVLWESERLGRVRFGTGVEDETHGVLVEAGRQIDEYFSGRRQKFALKLAPEGTEFQRLVWKALLTIPFGETRTYEQIARQIGRPTAMRAVGAANGRNPISLVVPCHRVIGASGNLTGFAGGLDAKAFLLALEAKIDGRAREGDKRRFGSVNVTVPVTRRDSAIAHRQP